MAERYKIYEKLGAGGVGAVFRAYDSQLKRWVAIKRLLSASETTSQDASTAELRREADSLASMRNPNIVTIFDVSSDAEGTFMVMELLEGEDLADVVERGPLHYDDFKELASQTLEGLMAAHHRHILHRDIKPENIKIERLPGGRLQSKIIDFGLARSGLRARKQTEDQEGTVMGSIYYMAPEQLTREPVDERTDLYALGCVFFEALAGRKAFDGESMSDVIDKHINHDVVPLHVVAPHVPPWLGAWVLRLMAQNPADRPVNAQQAIEEFRAWEKMAANPMAGMYAYGASMGGHQTQPMQVQPGPGTAQLSGGYYQQPIPQAVAYVEPVMQAQPVHEVGATTAPMVRPPSTPVPARPVMARPGSRSQPLQNAAPAKGAAADSGGGGKMKLYAMIGGGVVLLGIVASFLFGGKADTETTAGGITVSSPAATSSTATAVSFELPRDRAMPPADRDMCLQVVSNTGILASRKGPDGNLSPANLDEPVTEWHDVAERGGDNLFKAFQSTAAYGPKRYAWPAAATNMAGVKVGRTALNFKPHSGKPCSFSMVDPGKEAVNFPFGGGKVFTGEAGLTLAFAFQGDEGGLPTRILTLANDAGAKVTVRITAEKQVVAEFENGSSKQTITSKDADPLLACVAAVSWNAKTGAVDLRVRDAPGKLFRGEANVPAPTKPLIRLQIGAVQDANKNTAAVQDQYSGILAEVVMYAAALRNDQIQLLEGRTVRDYYLQAAIVPVVPPVKK